LRTVCESLSTQCHVHFYIKMKQMYQERIYRSLFKGTNLVFFDVRIFETDLRIGANKHLYDEAYKYAKKYRAQVELYLKAYKEFLTSLRPVEIKPGAPFIVEKMCKASEKAGVGPMAAVAGAISEMVGTELLKYSEEVIVENGGDIFIKTNIPRKIGIYAGNSVFSEKIALEIFSEDTPLGICTSSGTVGHSLSFGKADAAVIVSKDTFLADAVATATGNMVKDAGDIEKAIEFALSIEGIEGVLIIIGSKIGAQGNIRIKRL
jgi:ApbE superfamily uncharacterized protein (UPF0280 family)